MCTNEQHRYEIRELPLKFHNPDDEPLPEMNAFCASALLRVVNGPDEVIIKYDSYNISTPFHLLTKQKDLFYMSMARAEKLADFIYSFIPDKRIIKRRI